MSEKLNKKGETNVILEDDFDIQEAGIGRGQEVDWNDFEVMGANDEEEEKYVAPVEIE